MIAGVVFLLMPITLVDGQGDSLRCGTGMMGRDENAAKQYWLDQHRMELQATLDPVTGKMTGPGYSGTTAGGYTERTAPDCAGAVSKRRMWAIPLAIAGVIVLIGAATVRKEPDQPQKASEATE